MEVAYAPQFKRQFRKLPKPLQEEVLDKIASFQDVGNHALLRVHKLKGALAGRMSFSVNYRYRIVFMWESPRESAILLAIGDHTVYE